MIQLLIQSGLTGQGQLWKSGVDAVTHAGFLCCGQKLGQPGAQDLPAGWQAATTQLGAGSRLPALGFLSPSEKWCYSHCSRRTLPLSHARHQGRVPPLWANRRPWQDNRTHCVPTSPPSARH